MRTIELLSPVGNFDSLKCAVNNGANAVYLGLDNFNARGNIENFTFSNLAEAVEYAHLHSVKVYLTLNTLVGDDEFDDVIDYVNKALSCGVDAFIVQDIGLIYFLRQHFPFIELHGSTQMGLNNLEGVENISDLQLKRVVLARETPLSEIKRIRDNSSVEIEYFIQGALCVSFSGNCYLCSLLANASGNRGKCKQFCRLNYSLDCGSEKKEGYLLSTKDFCNLQSLKELYNSGVNSFKIEGRARRPAYVAVATNVYRRAIDNDFNYTKQDINDLKAVYNRGNYINGYFSDEKIIYPKAQNHIGVEIGKIENVKIGKRFNEITVESSHKLQKGDVLKIFNDDKEIGVVSVVDFKSLSSDRYLLTSTSSFPKNSKVNLIVDSHLEEKYMSLRKYIDYDVKLDLEVGQKVKMALSCQYANVELECDILPEDAKTKPLGEDEIRKQFSKSGENFKLRNVDLQSENVFLTVAQLNALRRFGLEKLQEQVLKNYEKRENLAKKSSFLQKNIEIFDKNKNSLDILLTEDLEKNYLSHDKMYIWSVNDFDDKIVEQYKKYSDYMVYISPPVMANKSEIDKIRDILSKCPNWGVVANNYYALSLKSADKTIIGSNLNVYNSYAVKYYAERGYKHIILSIEEHPYIKNCGVNLYCFKDYYPEYMYFRHCPFKEHLHSTCSNCTYKENLTYHLNNRDFVIKRKKIVSCQFVLKAKSVRHENIQENANAIEEI